MQLDSGISDRERSVALGALAILIALWFGTARVTTAEPLLAGVGVADISPDTTQFDVPLGGYGERMSAPAKGIHDPTMAKALIFQQGGTKFALVCVDLQGSTRSLREEVLTRVGNLGITHENLFIAASHSHGSLEMNTMHRGNVFDNKAIGVFSEPLLLYTAQQIAQAIRRADEKFEPVRIGVGSTEIEGMSRNRRGDEVTDNEMTVMRVDRADGGAPLAVFVNFTAHPTFLNETSMFLSAGWPGAMQRAVESALGEGTVAMYANGAEGDTAPRGGEGDDPYARAEDYGRKIARKVLALLPEIESFESGSMSGATIRLKLPDRVIPPALLESAGPEYGLTLDNIEALMESMQPAASYLSVLRVGTLVAVGIPGELAAGLGIEIKDALREAGAGNPIIVGLANEWISYILTPEGYHGGGYEPGVSFYGDQLGPVVVGQAIEAGAGLIRAD